MEEVRGDFMARRKRSARQISSNKSPGVKMAGMTDKTFGWLLVIVGLFLALSDLGILNLGLNIWTVIFFIFGLYFLSKGKS